MYIRYIYAEIVNINTGYNSSDIFTGYSRSAMKIRLKKSSRNIKYYNETIALETIDPLDHITQ